MSDINNITTASEAQEIIREIVKLGRINPTFHYNSRGQNLKNYSLQDVEYILENGIVTEPPVFDTTHQHLKCRVEGHSIDGDLTVVITAIVSYQELNIVTVFLK